jgi:hypothetical protein
MFASYINTNGTISPARLAEVLNELLTNSSGEQAAMLDIYDQMTPDGQHKMARNAARYSAAALGVLLDHELKKGNGKHSYEINDTGYFLALVFLKRRSANEAEQKKTDSVSVKLIDGLNNPMGHNLLIHAIAESHGTGLSTTCTEIDNAFSRHINSIKGSIFNKITEEKFVEALMEVKLPKTIETSIDVMKQSPNGTTRIIKLYNRMLKEEAIDNEIASAFVNQIGFDAFIDMHHKCHLASFYMTITMDLCKEYGEDRVIREVDKKRLLESVLAGDSVPLMNNLISNKCDWSSMPYLFSLAIEYTRYGHPIYSEHNRLFVKEACAQNRGVELLENILCAQKVPNPIAPHHTLCRQMEFIVSGTISSTTQSVNKMKTLSLIISEIGLHAAPEYLNDMQPNFFNKLVSLLDLGKTNTRLACARFPAHKRSMISNEMGL